MSTVSQMNTPPNKIPDKFEDVAMGHFDFLFNTALKLTWNREDAEDLVQDAYLRAYKFFNKFKEGTNFKAWIYKILMNTFINKYNKKLKIPKPIPFEEAEYSIKDTLIVEEKRFFPPDKIDIKKLFDDRIVEAIESMPKNISTSVLLYDIENYSYKEISAKLDIAIGTVMSRISRGRKILRRSLVDYAKEKRLFG